MSVIAAKVYDDKIVMAADSILVSGGILKVPSDFSKLKEINGMLIGGTGYSQEISMMWNYAETHIPQAPTEKEILQFMVDFCQYKAKFGDGNTINNNYIIAYLGHLFRVSGLFVFEVNNYAAVGAGEDFALAALYLGHSPVKAVKVACALSCYVADPITSYTQQRNIVK